MDYLYGKLNKLVEAQKYKFTSSDDTILILNNNNDGINQIDLSFNSKKSIKLLQVTKDADPSNDLIKYYALYAYNPNTNKFDIQLGDEIIVDTLNNGSGDDALPTILSNIQIVVGEEKIYDEDGNEIGTVPKYANLSTSLSEGGNLIFPQIPASAIMDTETVYDKDTGETITVQVQSNLDGNAGGEVY